MSVVPATAASIMGGTNATPEDSITDWYLPADDWRKGFLYPSHVMIADHPRLYPMARGLLERASHQHRYNKRYPDFRIREGHRSYRVHYQDTVGGPVYMLRRNPSTIPTLESLCLPPNMVNLLSHNWLNRGGLVMVCGETGQGKSTTLAALIMVRMMLHKAFCLTIEDPPELPLHGVHGEGHCLQTEVRGGNFPEALKGAMRCYPACPGNLLYVGEVRDRETAAEVLRIATNGHLVLTTLHAQDVQQSLSRLMSMAEGAFGSMREAGEIIAASMRLITHQTLEPARIVNGVAQPRRVNMEFLASGSGKAGAVGGIRKNELTTLAQEIDNQKRQLRLGTDRLLSLIQANG